LFLKGVLEKIEGGYFLRVTLIRCRTGKPIYNAIVWQDRRTADECIRLKEAGLEPMVNAKTGLVI